MRISGKLVIGVILIVAVAAATFSWRFRWRATRRAAKFWGREGVAAIQHPRRVDAFLFGASARAGPAATGRPGEVGLDACQMVATQEITDAPGMTHLRNALLEDRSFDWPASRPTALPIGYGLSFRANGRGCGLLVLFSQDFQWLMWRPAHSASLPEGDSGTLDARGVYTSVSIAPLAAGMRRYFAEVFPED